MKRERLGLLYIGGCRFYFLLLILTAHSTIWRLIPWVRPLRPHSVGVLGIEGVVSVRVCAHFVILLFVFRKALGPHVGSW